MMDINFTERDNPAHVLHRRISNLPGWHDKATGQNSWYQGALTRMTLLADGQDPLTVVASRDGMGLLVLTENRVIMCEVPGDEAGGAEAAVRAVPRRALESVSLGEGADVFGQNIDHQWPVPLTVTLHYRGVPALRIPLDHHGYHRIKDIWTDLLADLGR
jgi:hypothetical protein